MTIHVILVNVCGFLWWYIACLRRNYRAYDYYMYLNRCISHVQFPSIVIQGFRFSLAEVVANKNINWSHQYKACSYRIKRHRNVEWTHKNLKLKEACIRKKVTRHIPFIRLPKKNKKIQNRSNMLLFLVKRRQPS